MPSDMNLGDPQNIWRSQTTEVFKMSAEDLRRRARQRETRARLAAASTMAIGLVLCAFFAWSFARANSGIPRMGLGVLSLWGIYCAYQAYRWIWPGRLEADATVSTSLQFYRGELERQRDYNLHVWRRAGLTYCMLGLAMVVVPLMVSAMDSPRLLWNVAPVLVLLAIWLAVFFPIKRRKQRRLQREIDELQAFEDANRA
jgi:hypothetical protein